MTLESAVTHVETLGAVPLPGAPSLARDSARGVSVVRAD
jgi:hypothetical protein